MNDEPIDAGPPSAAPIVAVGAEITSNGLTTGGWVKVTAVGDTTFLGLVYGCRDWLPDGTEQWFDLEGWGGMPWRPR